MVDIYVTGCSCKYTYTLKGKSSRMIELADSSYDNSIQKANANCNEKNVNWTNGQLFIFIRNKGYKHYIWP